MNRTALGRRSFLATAAAAITVGAPAWGKVRIAPGIYPIAWTPCTAAGRMDTALLAAQADFCERGGVRGIVWPQLASAWDTLSEEEWQAGATALTRHAGTRALKIVLGVQAPGGDLDHAIARARAGPRSSVPTPSFPCRPPAKTIRRSLPIIKPWAPPRRCH